MTTPVRYIRDTLNRYALNGVQGVENSFLEIQARDANNINVALNKTVTMNFVSDQFPEVGRIVDGEFGNTNATVGTSTVTPATVTVDLGAIFEIANVTFWHYYGNARMYHGVVHEISTDGTNWTVIFDSDVNGEYAEIGSGHVLTAPLNAIVSPFPSGAVTSQPPPNGQSLTITFSTTNAPTSGMASLNPDATNPNGAVSTLGTIVFGTNTGTATFSNIPPGNYTPTITLTNAAGTRSVSGLQPVSIVGVTGNPAAGSTTTTSTSTVTSVVVSPTTASLTGAGTTAFTAVVNGTGSPSQAVTWTATAGAVTSSGAYTAPPATSFVQTITVTATSLQDSSKSANATVTVAASSDTTIPVMVGAITVSSITTTSCVISWPAATDNVAIIGYEISINNGATYTNLGNVLTTTQTGLGQGTPYYVKVRAYDAAGNRAIPLSATATTTSVTSTPSDTTAPVMQGNIIKVSSSQTGYVISWPAATDAVGVVGYKVSTDGGATYLDIGAVLTFTKTNATPGTIYQNRVVAYDAANNIAVPLSLAVTTDSPPVIVPNVPSIYTPAASRTIPVMAGNTELQTTDAVDYVFNSVGIPIFIKDPDATLDYSLNITDWLRDSNDVIGQVSATGNGCTISSPAAFSAGLITTFVTGGVVDEVAIVTIKWSTRSTPPRADERDILLKIKQR